MIALITGPAGDAMAGAAAGGNPNHMAQIESMDVRLGAGNMRVIWPPTKLQLEAVAFSLMKEIPYLGHRKKVMRDRVLGTISSIKIYARDHSIELAELDSPAEETGDEGNPELRFSGFNSYGLTTDKEIVLMASCLYYIVQLKEDKTYPYF